MSRAAADDEMVGRTHAFDTLQKCIEASAPLEPRQVFGDARAFARKGLERFAILAGHVTELEIGDQVAVVEHPAAEPGADRNRKYQAVEFPSRAQPHFRNRGGIRIVKYDKRQPGRALERLVDRYVAPCFIEIAGRPGAAVDDDGRETAADRTLVVEFGQ
ncbi:MAG: hypothetical protein P8X98_17610 [Woeseiaceae bacterium]